MVARNSVSLYFDNSNNTPATADPLLEQNLYSPQYYHVDDIDFYRLTDAEDLVEIGLDEYYRVSRA